MCILQVNFQNSMHQSWHGGKESENDSYVLKIQHIFISRIFCIICTCSILFPFHFEKESPKLIVWQPRSRTPTTTSFENVLSMCSSELSLKWMFDIKADVKSEDKQTNERTNKHDQYINQSTCSLCYSGNNNLLIGFTNILWSAVGFSTVHKFIKSAAGVYFSIDYWLVPRCDYVCTKWRVCTHILHEYIDQTHGNSINGLLK